MEKRDKGHPLISIFIVVTFYVVPVVFLMLRLFNLPAFIIAAYRPLLSYAISVLVYLFACFAKRAVFRKTELALTFMIVILTVVFRQMMVVKMVLIAVGMALYIAEQRTYEKSAGDLN